MTAPIYSGTQAGSLGNATESVALPALTNGYLIVGQSNGNNNPSDAATWNGVVMTVLARAVDSAGSNSRSSVSFGIAVGAGGITADYVVSGHDDIRTTDATWFEGVDQSTPFRDTDTDLEWSPDVVSVMLTSQADDLLVSRVHGSGNWAITAGTEQWRTTSFLGATELGTLVAAGATVTAEWTESGGGFRESLTAVTLIPAASGGGSFTLDAAHGSFTLSGQTTGLRADRRVAASHGSFDVLGQAAALRAARQIVAAHGALVLTGQAVALLSGRAITVGHGVFALSGQDANLRAARVLAADAGSIVLSGQTAVLKADRRLLADVGSFALSGQAVADVAGSGAISIALSESGIGSAVLIDAVRGSVLLSESGIGSATVSDALPS